MEKCKRGITLCLAVLFLILLLPIPRASAATVEEQVQEKIRWIIASIPDDCDTDYEKALWLHDYLCKTVTYQTPMADEAYTALLNGVADCGGYADAYMRLLRSVGIQAVNISGDTASGAHAWNMVILDGKCYFTDVCWDDQYEDEEHRLSFIRYNYFMISLEEIEKDHWGSSVMNSTLYRWEIPDVCNHNDLAYSYKDTGKPGSGHFNNSTTPEEAAKHFKVTKVRGSTVTWRCDFQFDGDATNWISANEFQIGKLLGGSVDIHGGWNGHGVLIYSGDADFVQTESIAFAQSTVRLTNSNMSQQLSVNFTPANASYQNITYTSSDSRIAKVDENGVVRAVSSGTATITATAMDGKTATCQVVVDHKHNAIRAVPAKAETCIANGNKAHYVCDSCGTLFSDSKGKNTVVPGDVITFQTYSCHLNNCSIRYNAQGHWMVCDICNKRYYPNIFPHEDWDDDGICNGMNNSTPCGYVMNPSATKPSTKPATKPSQQTTKPTQQSTNASQPATSTPIVPETSSATTSSVATVPDSTPPVTQSTAATGSAGAGTELVPSGSISTTAPDVQTPEQMPVIRWIVFGLSVVTVVAVVIWELRKRKKR